MLIRAKGLNSWISRDVFRNRLCREKVPAVLLKGTEFYFSAAFEETSACTKLEKEIGQSVCGRDEDSNVAVVSPGSHCVTQAMNACTGVVLHAPSTCAISHK